MIYILTHSVSDYVTDSSHSDMAFFGTHEEAYAEMEKQYWEKSRKAHKKSSDVLADDHALICDDDVTEKWNISENQDYLPLRNVFTGKQYTVSGFTKSYKDGSRCAIPAITFFSVNEAKTYLRTLYDAALKANGLKSNNARNEQGKLIPGGFIESDGMYACIYKKDKEMDSPEAIAVFSIEEGTLLQFAGENGSSEPVKEESIEKSLFVVCECDGTGRCRIRIFTSVPFVNLDDAKRYLARQYQECLKNENLPDNGLADDGEAPVSGGRMSRDGMCAEIWYNNSDYAPDRLSCINRFEIHKVDVTVPVKSLGENGYPDKLAIVSIAKRNQENSDLLPVEVFAFFDSDEAESYMLKTHRKLCREFCVSNYDDDHDNFGMVEDSYRAVTHESEAYVLKKVPYASGNRAEVVRLKLNISAVIRDLDSKEDTVNYAIHRISQLIAENEFNSQCVSKPSMEGYTVGADTAYNRAILILESLCPGKINSKNMKGKENE